VLAVRRHHIVRQGGLQHAQRLAELHRAAFQLPERPEELLGGALLHVGQDGVRRGASEAATQADGLATGVPQGQGGEPRRAGGCLAR
jgi:hypothetical protein